MGIVRFVDRTPTIKPPVKSTPRDAILKYSLKKDLPVTSEQGIMYYTTDTQEIFHGAGFGMPLKRISDVMVYDSYSQFPRQGIEQKIYVELQFKGQYVWKDEGYVKISGSSEGPAGPGITEEFNKLIASTEFIGYKQRLIIGPDSKMPLVLDHIPSKDAIKVYVNGVNYDKPSYMYDRATRKLYWTFTSSNGGFDLQNGFEVLVSYNFLYNDNEITDIESFVNTHRKRD